MLPAPAAVPIEKAAPVKVCRVPLVLRKPILKLVNESELQLEDLSALIYNHLKVFFLPGEVVQLVGAKQDGNIIKGSVIKRRVNKIKMPLNASLSTPTDAPSPFSYDIKIFEKSEVVTAIPNTALRRLPCSPSMNVLQAFIQANAKYVENSSSHLRWILSNKMLLKPKKNLVLKKALSEQKKNVKPALIPTEKRKLENNSENSKILHKNKKALLKSDTLQPALKSRKLGKLAKSPKSGVPPIWAKLLKSFPLEPEVVLVRLEDGNGGTSDTLASLQKSKLKEKSTSLVCGKENKASCSPNKKMKQMTLFDMNKKLVPPSVTKSAACSVKIEVMDCTIPAAISGAADDMINVTCDIMKKDQPKMVKESKKVVDFRSNKTESAQLQKSSKVKSPAASNKSLVNDLSITKISFRDFTTKIKSNQEKESMKSTSQGTLDGILKKGVAHVKKVVKPLPPPTPVKTPLGFDNEWFGDAAMIIQFISSFRNILQPDKSISLSTAMLMDAIMTRSNGFHYLNNILVCLLRTLVQGCSTKEYEEAGVSLSDVPITIYSASELTRLCLRVKEDDEDSIVLDKKLDFLFNMELHQLEPYDKLKIICYLCSNVLVCYTIENYVNEIQKNLKKLRGENLHVVKEKNKIKRMLRNQTPKNSENASNLEKLSPEQKLNPGSFYGPLAMNDSTEKGPNVGELQSASANRRLSLLKAKEEKLKAEKLKGEQALKEKEELKKQKDEEDLRKNLEFHVKEMMLLKGLSPLGKDRNMTRYWLFCHFTPQLVLEKGWWEEFGLNDKTNEDCETKSPLKKAKLDVVSCKHENRWFAYETVEEVKALVQCLSMEDNENDLKLSLKKYLTDITAAATETKSKDENEVHPNGDLVLMEAFRDEMLEMHSKITEGVLGKMGQPEKWLSDVENANTCQNFGQCLLALQNSLYPKFLCGAFGHTNASNCKVEINKKEKSDLTGNLETWQQMVKSCHTMSRLHVLLGLLSACIQWDKSSAKTKCKVCRKNNEDVLLLCDDCSKGFHLGCLRPRLRSVPKDDWFCPSCKKSKEESERESESESEESSEEDSSEEEDAIVAMKKKVACSKCKQKGDERLLCVKCYKGWHPTCYSPPMRNIPRGTWFCQKCCGKKGRRASLRRK